MAARLPRYAAEDTVDAVDAAALAVCRGPTRTPERSFSRSTRGKNKTKLGSIRYGTLVECRRTGLLAWRKGLIARVHRKLLLVVDKQGLMSSSNADRIVHRAFGTAHRAFDCNRIWVVRPRI